jgi:hypothetical protein
MSVPAIVIQGIGIVEQAWQHDMKFALAALDTEPLVTFRLMLSTARVEICKETCYWWYLTALTKDGHSDTCEIGLA